jgi:hypothetical protein
MAAAMIGVDPHKGSHTAVVIDAAPQEPQQWRVRLQPLDTTNKEDSICPDR